MVTKAWPAPVFSLFFAFALAHASSAASGAASGAGGGAGSGAGDGAHDGAAPPGAGPAAAPRPQGVFELVRYDKGGTQQPISAALFEQYKRAGHDPVVVRMTFELSGTSLTAETYVFERDTRRTGEGSVCDAKLTLDVAWSANVLTIPATVKAESHFVRVMRRTTVLSSGAKKTDSESSENVCNASLKAGTLRAEPSGELLLLRDPEGGALVLKPVAASTFARDVLIERL